MFVLANQKFCNCSKDLCVPPVRRVYNSILVRLVIFVVLGLSNTKLVLGMDRDTNPIFVHLRDLVIKLMEQ